MSADVHFDPSVVTLAHAMLRLDAARQYGFLAGGPTIDVDQCERWVAIGQEHGFEPTDEEIDVMAVEFTRQFNAAPSSGEQVPDGG